MRIWRGCGRSSARCGSRWGIEVYFFCRVGSTIGQLQVVAACPVAYRRVRTDFEPKVFIAYKDVTYQTFKDEKFRELMEKRFGKDAINAIFNEHDAAPEQVKREP
jgi:hypothetical protein